MVILGLGVRVRQRSLKSSCDLHANRPSETQGKDMETARLIYKNKEYELPVVGGTED